MRPRRGTTWADRNCRCRISTSSKPWRTREGWVKPCKNQRDKNVVFVCILSSQESKRIYGSVGWENNFQSFLPHAKVESHSRSTTTFRKSDSNSIFPPSSSVFLESNRRKKANSSFWLLVDPQFLVLYFMMGSGVSSRGKLLRRRQKNSLQVNKKRTKGEEQKRLWRPFKSRAFF